MEQRRRVPRQATGGWPGMYSIQDEREPRLNECRVVDISVIGAGLVAFGRAADDLVGQRIVVDIQPPSGASVSIKLIGDVKNASPDVEGGVRVGIEFAGLSETERSILQVLELMQIAW